MSSKLGLIRTGCFAFSGVLFLSVALIAQAKIAFALEQPLVVPYAVRVASAGAAE